MRRLSLLFLLTALAFSASAVEKTRKIYNEDGEVRVECKTTFERNSKSTVDIVNYLTSLSTIKGTQYYSQRENKVTTLFTDAYTVDKPRNANRIEDHHLVPPLPQSLDIYGMLEDSRFKDNVYQFSYLFEESHIKLKITNMDTLKYGFIKAIDAQCFNITMDISITENEIQVSSTGACKPAVLPSFLEKRVNNAIANRIDALFGWFEKGITEK